MSGAAPDTSATSPPERVPPESAALGDATPGGATPRNAPLPGAASGSGHSAPLGNPWLRRADQAALAVIVLALAAATAAWWFARGGHRGELIEIDGAAPLEARYELDLNTCEWPELAALPGIGETLARRIVESRQTEGPFRSVDDLRRVPGIGPKTVERLREHFPDGEQ